jgi:hypothetical protein
MMKTTARWAAIWLAAVFCSVAPALAQQTGEIYGKVTDASSGVLPGVTVSVSGSVLLQPLTAVTTETGTFRFPQVPIGAYTVRFDLAGFKSVVKPGVRVEIGLNVQVNQALEISSVQETVTVTGAAQLVDLRDTGKTNRFTQEALQGIPSARDPWVIIEQSAGVAMDRQNVGGSASGQQSNFVARGAAMREQKWNLDGVDITDMSATGGSPVYFDFDAFEEMQISTGGSDVTMQSPGVGVNLVTKSGSDKVRGSGRFYVTDERFQSFNVTDELRRQGGTTGNPILNIKDYGFEAGGPVKKGRAWIWGSYGKQDVSVGINNFYKSDAACQAMKTTPMAYSLKAIRDCLSPDSTLLNNYNAKFALQVAKNNQFSMFYNAAEKVRNARDASDLRPLETTYRQIGVTRSDLGSTWWKTGMPKSYKWSDRHVFSDRFMIEGSYAHVGNNFALAFHDESLRAVQPMLELSTNAWSRSYQENVYVRPTDTVDVLGNYFVPGWLHGDHSFKFGFKYRNDVAHSETMYGGDAYARVRNGGPVEAQLYRRGYSEYGLHNRNFYAQDSVSFKRVTLNLGFRYDYQTDYASAANVGASPLNGQRTYEGEITAEMAQRLGLSYTAVGIWTGAPFTQLPALAFGGADAGVAFKNFSPRVGFTYDIQGNSRSVLKVNYARYVGQLGTGDMSSTYNTVALTYVRYPWVDLNGDRFVQANEVVLTAAPLAWTTGYNYLNPSQVSATGTVDPKLSADWADEILVGFDKAVGTDFAVSASYIWRKYQNFRANKKNSFDASNWRAVQWTPDAATCPAGASCPTVTYYEPTSQIPTDYTYANVKDFWRGYQGVELSVRKRLSHRWSMNASYSWNDAPMHFDSLAGSTWLTTPTWQNSESDPTNVMTSFNNGQFAPESSSSGLGNVFVNATWIVRASATYTLPWWDINAAAFYNARQGYPFVRSVLTPFNRPFSAGQSTIYLDRRGDERLPNFQTVDFRVDKPFTFFGRLRVVASMDVFNLLNGNTTLSMRGGQNATNANTISSLLAPRVLRLGARVTW